MVAMHESYLVIFWTSLFEYFEAINYQFHDNRSANDRYYIGMPSAITPSPYNFVIGKDFARIELYFGKKNNKDDNKFLFDTLFKEKNEIESEVGTELMWARMEDKLASKIFINISADCYSDEENSAIHEWFASNYIRFEKAFSKRVLEASISTSFNLKEVRDVR